MRVLITGGLGFIGSHLVEALLKQGAEVCVIDDLSTGSLQNIAAVRNHPKLKIFIDSVLNYPRLREAAEDCEHIYHLAAAVGVRLIVEEPLRTLKTNIQGTEKVMEVANEVKAKVLITSTSEIYGKNEKVPFKETDDRILGPTNINRWSYSTSKAVDEILALAYWREKKLPVVVVRLFNTCGPRQTGQYGMVVPRFIKQALSAQPITVFGDGQQTRSFTYVDDTVKAIQILMSSPKAVGEIFNVGNNKEVSILELAELVIKITNSASKIEMVPYNIAYEEGFEDMRRRVPDINKLIAYTGFRPQVELAEIIRRVVDYMKS